MTTLPIRRIILYKHGVGFFERRGQVDDQAVQFTFRRDEMNDALKSLTVIDRSGGQVLGVHYETPEDKAARLADSSIVLSDDHSLLDLLRALRGRMVRLGLTDGERSGRLLGVDVDEKEPLAKSSVAVLDNAAQTVLNLPVSALRQITLLDERAAHDLRFFLDLAMSEEVRRTVTVRLSPGAHDLSVFYLAPSPTWRVSYRVVAERDPQKSDAVRAETGKLVLQGWGLFDNRLDEDLEDTQVTLVAGMPISFIYDLATSRIPERPVVEDQARIAAGPVEFQASPKPKRGRRADAYGAEGMADEERSMAESAPMLMAAAAPAPGGPSLAAMAPQTAQAQGADMGELFQYAVTTPVSVRRGESAMVPIISAALGYARELLYNGQKMPTHPVVAARFQNETGLTLERGPVTVVEDGDYRGEAMVPFTKAGSEVYLAYAVELGVKVTEHGWQTAHMAALRLQGQYLLIEEWLTQHSQYQIENSTGGDLTLTLEKTKLQGYELTESEAPAAETAGHYRWRVACPAEGLTTYVVNERTRRSRYEQVLQQSYDQLSNYLKEKWLDQDTYERLKSLLDERAQIARNEQELGALQNERNEIYARQEQVRKNMEVMSKDNAEETQLRRRLRQQLEQSEDRLAAIDARSAELKADNERRRKAIEVALEKLK